MSTLGSKHETISMLKPCVQRVCVCVQHVCVCVCVQRVCVCVFSVCVCVCSACVCVCVCSAYVCVCVQRVCVCVTNPSILISGSPCWAGVVCALQFISLHWPCSDLRTSMSTLQHSTLSVLNKYADLQMLVLFQMQYSVAHLTEMTSAARPRHPPNTLIH